MQFSGLTNYKPNLECKLISKHLNRDYIVKKLKITINFNENNVNIGDAYETKITIPKDCKKVR